MAGNMTRSIIPGGGIWLLFLFVFAGYAVLNRGFAYIGYYPVFIGEIVLLFYLLVLRHSVGLSEFLRTPAFWAIVMLYAYCVTMFIIASFKDVAEALRNSVFWVYPVFFYLGWRFARSIERRKEQHKLEYFIVGCALAVTLYHLIYPVRDFFLDATVYTQQGGGVALIGYYSTLHALAIGFVLFPLYLKHSIWLAIITAMGLSLIVFISQSRGAMVALVIIFLYMLMVERQRNFYRNVVWVLLFSVIGAVSFSVLDLSVKGQRGEVSLELVTDAAASILLGSDQDTWAGSRADRLTWWADIVGRTMSDWKTAIFGLGFDQILLDRETSAGSVLRYPHNSYVTVLGLAGLFGLALYLWLVILVFARVFRKAKSRNSPPVVRWYPVFAIAWLVSAFFSTVFEAPFHGFVFWSASGIAYYMAMHTPKDKPLTVS